jgi:Na+/H+-translocating membrane pyrophosphatase
VQDWTFGIFSGIAFLCGAVTSSIAGYDPLCYITAALTEIVYRYIGIKAATVANGRVALKISDQRDSDHRPGIQKGFETCLRGGAVMAFGMFTVTRPHPGIVRCEVVPARSRCLPVQIGIVNLLVLTTLYQLHYDTCNNALSCKKKSVSYCLLAYALGATAVNFHHRVGVRNS